MKIYLAENEILNEMFDKTTFCNSTFNLWSEY